MTPNQTYPRCFVRITYQECVEDGTAGGFIGRGIKQDIRLVSGWFRIADDQAPEGMAYEIVAGRLQERATSTLPGLAHSHLEIVRPDSDKRAKPQ
jgi:hypothetical protein